MKTHTTRPRTHDCQPIAPVLAMAFVLLALFAGCARVPIASQRLVSRPNMVFADSMIFNDQRRLLGQVEPGSAFGGGAQASGCTACK